MKNLVQITGNLGQVPTETHLGNGGVAINFAVAVSRDYFDNNSKSWQKREPTWVQCVSFNENHRYLTALNKGQRIYVQGELISAPQDFVINGMVQKMTMMKVKVENFEVCLSKNYGKADGGAGQYQYQNAQPVQGGYPQQPTPNYYPGGTSFAQQPQAYAQPVQQTTQPQAQPQTQQAPQAMPASPFADAKQAFAQAQATAQQAMPTAPRVPTNPAYTGASTTPATTEQEVAPANMNDPEVIEQMKQFSEMITKAVKK